MLKVSFQVHKDENYTIFNDLMPFTWYQVTVVSENIIGTSLPTYAVKTLTLAPGKMKETMNGKVPTLPDIKSCCVNKGMKK